MDVVANNLANATTTRLQARPDGPGRPGLPALPPADGGKDGQVGLGAAPGAMRQGDRAGRVSRTPAAASTSPIQGDGLPPGDAPGRHARLHAGRRPARSTPTAASACPAASLLQPRITVPATASDVAIAGNGDVTATVDGAITKLGDDHDRHLHQPGRPASRRAATCSRPPPTRARRDARDARHRHPRPLAQGALESLERRTSAPR